MLPARGPRRGEAGFTVAELTVTMIVLVEIILAVLLLFDYSSKLGKAEMQVADMQQSLRVGQFQIVRMVRMAGRGELPVTNNPGGAVAANLFTGTSLSVRNNVSAGSGVITGKAPTDPPGALTNPRVFTGTDVLTVRGVFSTPLYQVNYSDPKAFTYSPITGLGTVTISSTSPTGVPQPFDTNGAPGSFADAITYNRLETLILVSPLDDTIYGVAQLDPGSSQITGTAPALTVKLAFTTANVGNVPLSANGAFPNLKSVAYVGILEEYRYYVREVHAAPADLNSEPNPRLSRARFYAGTDNPWNADVLNLYQDIAEGVLDLQVALGFDFNPPNVPTANWQSNLVSYLFDTAANNGTAAPFSPLPSPFPPLESVRVNVLARTNRHDLKYKAPLIASIEDHTYNPYNPNPPNPWDPNGPRELNMRRRWTQTVVGIRNRI